MKFPELKTARLTLTALSRADQDSVFELFSDAAVTEYYDLDRFQTLNQAATLIAFFNTRFAENSGIRWAIRLTDSNQLIGTCGFNSWSTKMKNAVIGYDLRSDYWRKGYGAEAARRIVKAAFEGELPCGLLHRIQADTVPGNMASESLLLKLGFQEEGLRRQSGYWKGRFHDLKCFGLLKSEFCCNA